LLRGHLSPRYLKLRLRLSKQILPKLTPLYIYILNIEVRVKLNALFKQKTPQGC